MNDTPIDFGPVTDRVADLVGRIRDDQLSGPTPCEDYTLGALLNHALGLSWAFTSAAKKQRGPHTDTPPQAPSPVVDPEWRDLLPIRLGLLAEAWRDPEAWKGEATAGGVTFPAEAMGLVALNEVAIHGWDLARASGQHFEIPPDVIETLLEFDGQDADDQDAREGAYAPVVPVGADASPQDRLIAITGRDPAWSPNS